MLRRQLREAIAIEDGYRYLIHDRDSIFSKDMDRSVEGLGLDVLKSPVRSPKANSICERLIGTVRRECLDWVIPLSESYLRSLLKEWAVHYNEGRPHMALGPGVPSPPVGQACAKIKRIWDGAERLKVRSRSVLGGLHHEYSLAPAYA